MNKIKTGKEKKRQKKNTHTQKLIHYNYVY